MIYVERTVARFCVAKNFRNSFVGERYVLGCKKTQITSDMLGWQPVINANVRTKKIIHVMCNLSFFIQLTFHLVNGLSR